MRVRSPFRMLGLAVVAAGAVIVLAACGYQSPPAATPPSATAPSSSDAGPSVSVPIQNFTFAPQTLTVQAGTTVTWTNEDSVIHTVTSADGISTDAATTALFDSGSLGQGDTYSHTFETSGTYYYLCVPHRSMPGMHAEVVVE